MKYLKEIRNVSLAVFIVAMVIGWPSVVRADPEYDRCVNQLPYLGYDVHDHEFECPGDYGAALCDAWCVYCWQTSCAYLNNCQDGWGYSGACFY